MKRMFFLFHGRFPSEKAASLFAAKNAEAFARQGLIVTVIVPLRKGVDPLKAYDFYGISRSFDIVTLPSQDFFGWPMPNNLAFSLNFLAFSWACYGYLRKEAAKAMDNDPVAVVAYSNESLPLYAASRAGFRTFYEMHDFPESKFGLFNLLVKRFTWILIHNRWKMEKFKKVFPATKAKIICEANAVDIQEFDIDISKEEARKRLGLSLDKKIAVYTGHLFGWKGVAVLAAAADLSGDDLLTVFVGGTDRDVEDFRRKHAASGKIMIVGYKPHQDMPIWQKAADVLVLPNTAKEAISAYYTSPMKLFEYMASKRPIVASDIPSIREIVDENCAILVKADDPVSLAEGIKKAVTDEALAGRLSAKAFERVSGQTWDKRAVRIMDFMKR